MVTVFFRNRTYIFSTYQEARQFERDNPGSHVATPQQSYEEPRQYQQPRSVMPMPPSTPSKSIIPNMMGKYSGENAYRMKKFDPRNPRRYDVIR